MNLNNLNNLTTEQLNQRLAEINQKQAQLKAEIEELKKLNNRNLELERKADQVLEKYRPL